MNVVRMSSRLAATGAVTALAAAGLVGLGTTAANAATVMNTYTCSVPDLYTGDFPMTVTGELPVPQYYAGAPVPQGLLGIEVTVDVPDDAAQLLGAFGVDGARSGDFAFTLGNASVPVPISGDFTTTDAGTTWDAVGANAAFVTPAPGHYDAILPSSFTLTTTSGGADGAQLGCVLAEGETAQALTSIDLLQQNSTTDVKPATVTVKKGKVAKLPTTVSGQAGSPSGKIVAKEGSKKVGTAVLENGKAVIKLTKLSVGKHKITVSYAGNPSITGSSDKVTVKVTK